MNSGDFYLIVLYGLAPLILFILSFIAGLLLGD